MPYRLCRHIKANGTSCQAPALSSQVWCYFHARLHHRHNGFRYSDTVRPRLTQPTIPANFNDSASIQAALSAVIQALASGKLETRRASALLYGIQLASINSSHPDIQPHTVDVTNSIQSQHHVKPPESE